MRRDTIDLEKERAHFRLLAEKIVELAKPDKKSQVRRDLESILEAAVRRAQFTCVKGGKQRDSNEGE
jgi:hypothetical protein